MDPFLAGIAGPSCSGKTELARALTRFLQDQALLFTMDHYYVDRSHIPPAERHDFNFDHPEALDHELIVRDVQALKLGLPIEQPRYSFITDSRLSDTQPLAPRPVVLVEGLFSLYWPELRDLLDLTIYVETSDEICFARRLARDVQERGRSPESIERQYRETVRPMAEQFVRPTSQYADLIVSGVQPLDASVRSALEAIESRRRAQSPLQN